MDCLRKGMQMIEGIKSIDMILIVFALWNYIL